MEKNTKITDKDFSWYLDVEDEADDESTSKEETAVPETGSPTDEQNTENTMHSEPVRNTGNIPVQRRVSAKMRKETLEAYKQAYLVPIKLSNRKAVYLSRETQERADFIVRRLGDRGSNLSSFVENIVRFHLEEYGEDIEKAVNPRPFSENRATDICRINRTMRVSRTQAGTECTAFIFRLQNFLCVNVSLADIARRQFVPTNCSCSPC